jgi:hypothetical protein
MFLSNYLGLGNDLEGNGVFDPILDKDSHFFINLQRLKNTSIPEFESSYEKIHDHFRKIIKLLEISKEKNKKDNFYKQALKLFNFSEVNGICLGYSEGGNGTG